MVIKYFFFFNWFWYFLNTGNEEVIKVLVEKGAEVDAINKVGSTPLHYACAGGKYMNSIL